MSITSVGGSFGYIDPASVAGPSSAVSQSTDTSDTPPPASASPGNTSNSGAPSGNPPPTPPQATSSDTPKFSPATGAALVQVQEKATAA